MATQHIGRLPKIIAVDFDGCIVSDKAARRRCERLVHANFVSGDLSVVLTYDIRNTYDAVDEEIARRDIRNYIRRVRDYRKRRGLPELKYIYVMEYRESEAHPIPDHVHFHLIMSSMDRDEAERLWTDYTPHAGYANADALKSNDEAGIAGYMLKAPRGKRRWVPSKNLIDPLYPYCRMRRRD